MRTFVTSDLHLGHFNIIAYCNRPWSTVETMNADLVRRWNETVGPEDVVLFGGDFTLGKNVEYYLDRLNGYVGMVLGNHDRKVLWKKQLEKVDSKVLFVQETWQGYVNGVCVVMSHYCDAVLAAKNPEKLYLYSHSHDRVPTQLPNAVNVCVEQWNYTPVELDRLVAEFKERTVGCVHSVQ